MVWINDQHFNISVPPGVFGGAKCLCSECEKTRQSDKRNAIEIMQDAQLCEAKEVKS